MRSAEFKPIRYATLSVSEINFVKHLLHCLVSKIHELVLLFQENKLFFTLCAVRLCLLFPLLLFELHVPIMHNGTSQLVDAILLLLGEAQDIKCFLKQQRRQLS